MTSQSVLLSGVVRCYAEFPFSAEAGSVNGTAFG
jgi:hypothetical protein